MEGATLAPSSSFSASSGGTGNRGREEKAETECGGRDGAFDKFNSGGGGERSAEEEEEEDEEEAPRYPLLSPHPGRLIIGSRRGWGPK